MAGTTGADFGNELLGTFVERVRDGRLKVVALTSARALSMPARIAKELECDNERLVFLVAERAK